MRLTKQTIAAVLLSVLLPPCRAKALAAGDMLAPVGRAVAIELETDGILVAGLSQIDTEDGAASPAEEAGLRSGDRITAVNGEKVTTGEEFLSALAEQSEGEILLTAERDGREDTYPVQPVRGRDGERYLGLLLRSGISGLGTVTFQDPLSGVYGALGHGVSLNDDESLTPVSGGAIGQARVEDIKRGEKGAPGELVGVPDGGAALGSVESNTLVGIFGSAEPLGGEPLPAAAETEIVLGDASILTTVRGSEPEEYAVEITRLSRDTRDGRQISLTVTDERLLSLTGGIVQGMSGSPILQNGKLIGAVTHVLVEDPTRGYGVSIENMLSAAG